MVWPYIPGCNIHRGAEGDNTVESFGVTRKPHKLRKENSSGPKWSAVVMHTSSKPPHPPTAAVNASRPVWNLARSSVSTERGVDHCVWRTGVESENAPCLNTKYCPELGVMYELAKGRLPSKRLKFNFPDLFPEKKKQPDSIPKSFQEPARLVSSESLVRWNVPSIPWRYLVEENAKPITMSAITKDTQTALTCVTSDLDRSTDGNSESSMERRPHAMRGSHRCKNVKRKDRMVSGACEEKLSKGVQTPRHKGVQTEIQDGPERSLDAEKSCCSSKEGSSKKAPASKSIQVGSPQTGKIKSAKTSETSSSLTKAQKTNSLSASVGRRIDSNNRTSKDRLIKARKGKKRIWKKNLRSPTRDTLISNLLEAQMTPARAQSKRVIECVAPREEKTQVNAENSDDVEARKLHVQPTLPMPVKCTTLIGNIPLAKHEPVPNVVAQNVEVEESGQRSDADFHTVEDLDTKNEKEQWSISERCRDAATEGHNSDSRMAWTQLDNTDGTEPVDATKDANPQQDQSDDYLLRITPKKKTAGKSARAKNAYIASSSRQRKTRDKTTRIVQETSQPVESVSIASSTESLEALERLIEMQHAELVSKGVLPADKDLPSNKGLDTKSKDDYLRLLLDDGSTSTVSTTSLPNEGAKTVKEETANVVSNQSYVIDEESFQDSYLSQLMQSLSLTQSDDEGVEKSSIESSLIEKSGTSEVSDSNQKPNNNSSSETADSATAAALVALTDYQSRMSSDRRIYDVEVFRQ